MMNREVERRLAEATEMAKQNRHEFVTLEHILLALTKSPIMVEILEANSVNVQKLKKDLKLYLKTQGTQITNEQIESYGGFDAWNPEFTLACHRLIQRAALQVKSSGKNKITEGSLLVSLFYEKDSQAVHFLSQQGLSQFDVVNYISHGISQESDASFLPPPSGEKSEENHETPVMAETSPTRLRPVSPTRVADISN